MARGRKRAEVAAEPRRIRERNRSAVTEPDKDPQDDAPEASGPRRSARIRATKSAPHPKEKDQLSPQQSHQQIPRPKALTRSRSGGTTLPDLERDTTPAKPLAKKGKSTASEGRKGRQIFRSSRSKIVSKPQQKATAKANRQDPTSQVQPPRKGAKRGKAKRSGPAAVRPTRKTAKGKAKSADSALGSSSESVPGDEPGRHGRREGSESLDGLQPLTREALEELTRKLGSVGAACDGEPTYTSGTTGNDPRERFNYKYGYLPPLDEETSRIIAAIINNPASVKKMARIGPDSQELFKKGLVQRNVRLKASRSVDPRSEEIKSFGLGEIWREGAEQRQFCEHLWQRDKAKLTEDSSEAIFQRTLMVSLIARHFLIYEKEANGEQLLDFSAEELWTCLPMPSRALWNPGLGLDVDEKLLTQCKPDLAVCFKREAVIEDGLWSSLPEATKELACFENHNSGTSRIFHFLAVEAKNAATPLADPKGLYQSLNNASQALNNFYEFFQDAGPTHRQIFFDKIRFFSVVANTQGILIRIHRAVEIAQDASQYQLVMRNRPEYRLTFEYREFARLTGEDEFTREKVIEAFTKMLKYAADELSIWISAAAKDLMEKLEKDWLGYDAREKVGFYRHGQPSPNTSRNTPRSSRFTSKSGSASLLSKQLLNAKMASAAQSFAEESTNGQITPKAKIFQQNSQSSKRSTKRSISQVHNESTDSGESQVARKRSRKAEDKQRS